MPLPVILFWSNSKEAGTKKTDYLLFWSEQISACVAINEYLILEHCF